MTEPAPWWASLPTHLAAASALFRDAEGRVLMVKPTYRDGWLLPGGAMDPGEYPWEAARREVKEELDIDLGVAPRLLAVDWIRPLPDGRPAMVAFTFDGGLLTREQAESRISLPPDELSDWRFVDTPDWGDYAVPTIARRLPACIDALVAGTTAYLEDGAPGARAG